MYQLLNVLALFALTSAATTSYEVETVTDASTVDVTITSCSGHPSCAAYVAETTNTVVTETVDGIETVYTTVCPVSAAATTAAPASSPIAKAAEPAAVSSSSEEIEYVDVTTTPTVTASTGVEATITLQSTFVSSYSSTNTSSLAAVNTFEGAANQRFAVGAAGVAALAAYLV